MKEVLPTSARPSSVICHLFSVICVRPPTGAAKSWPAAEDWQRVEREAP